ncbi:MAG TPA: hypothetical protein VGI45_18080 [Terracidiphilus sp.]
MNASEDTKIGPSVVAESLRTLTEQAKLCHQKIDLLEAGQNFNRAEILVEVGKLLDACQNLRDAILSEDSSASWSSRAELSGLVGRIEDTAAKRRRYLDLAQVLGTGTVVHRRERTRLERLALRDTAVAELMEISERPTPPELPGPGVEEWLEWACSLEDESDEVELQKLKANFPRLDDFVRQLEIDWWHAGTNSAAERREPVSPPSRPSRKNGSNGSHVAAESTGSGLTQAVAEEIPAAAIPVAADTHEEETVIPTQEQHQVGVEEDSVPESTFVESPFTASLSAEEVEIPSELLNPSRKGKVSLFPWDQVDQFTHHIEKAKVERKDVRTVRALLAVSHWLGPQEQNPVFHPNCGIRALTGYTGNSEPSIVSPSEVSQAIALDDGLPLLTGGADLLRWGLLQPSERNFQGITSVRRLSQDHLKAWFSELYRIALSDKQIDDIYNLTSGIPYLVGELHKLIIPSDDPPTWLGLARWIEIKAQFEKQIPDMAHDLKKGTPSARLTDREISLLNMIVIVSADSTRETILANLSENWDRYQHPEYRALGSRDEVSLAVLLELGLLPRRNVVGALPSHCILPVKHDDAIHKIVEHL